MLSYLWHYSERIRNSAVETLPKYTKASQTERITNPFLFLVQLIQTSRDFSERDDKLSLHLGSAWKKSVFIGLEEFLD